MLTNQLVTSTEIEEEEKECGRCADSNCVTLAPESFVASHALVIARNWSKLAHCLAIRRFDQPCETCCRY